MEQVEEKIKPKDKFKAIIANIKFHRLRKINRITILTLLSYLHVLVIIPIIFSRRNPFIVYHAKQGLVLLSIWMIAVFSLYLPYIPFVLVIFLFSLILYGSINVFLNRSRPLPLIGKIAEKI